MRSLPASTKAKKQKMRKAVILAVILSFDLTACRKVDIRAEQQTEYLVFGKYFGECFGKGCVRTYLIKNGKLYEDTLDNYPNGQDPVALQTIELGPKEYLAAHPLIQDFPTEILLHKDTVYGEPDGGDWGGLYLEVMQNGKRRFWLLDNLIENNPRFLQDYAKQISETTENLAK